MTSSAAVAIAGGPLARRGVQASAMRANRGKGELNLGFMVWRIGELLDFDAQVEWVAQAGFESISFHASAGIPGKWRGVDPATASPKERRRIKKLLSRFRMCEIHAPFDAKLQAKTPAKVIKKLEEVLEFAQDVGATVVTVHADPPPLDKGDRAVAWHRALNRLDTAAGKAGARIGIEFNTGFEWLRRPRRTWIGATLDVGHMYIGGGKRYRPYGTVGGIARSLGELLFHVHIHDYDGKVDHIEIGTGRIDFADVLGGLADIDYRGALCLELNPNRVSPDGIRRSADALRRLEKGLKRS